MRALPLILNLFLVEGLALGQESDTVRVGFNATVLPATDEVCPADGVLQSALDDIRSRIPSKVREVFQTLLVCTPHITGQVGYCPADNCSQIFGRSEGASSAHYWLQASNGGVVYVYCVLETASVATSSCQELFEIWPERPSGVYQIRSSDGDIFNVYCNNETRQPDYESCAQIHQLSPNLPSGNYTVRNEDGSSSTVYCAMGEIGCEGGGWLRVVSYNFTDSSTPCPSGWQAASVGACGRTDTVTPGCDSAVFPTNGVNFTQVCGRVIAYKYGFPDAFWTYHLQSRGIDDYYIDGVSITHGNSPRKHIWSLAGNPFDGHTDLYTQCRCSLDSSYESSIPLPPDFVGNNYFCDTGWNMRNYDLEDPLWDGEGCASYSTCCTFNAPPWFSTTLSEATSDDIEVRICNRNDWGDEDTPIAILELYIK